MNLGTNKIPAAKLNAGMTNDGEWYDAGMMSNDKWNETGITNNNGGEILKREFSSLQEARGLGD
ncbi:MAG: hypothetical protein NTX91_05220 [candidate division SR1 bacterium]|nr:hypothetical protein [candidate division SR1 bacterium]